MTSEKMISIHIFNNSHRTEDGNLISLMPQNWILSSIYTAESSKQLYHRISRTQIKPSSVINLDASIAHDFEWIISFPTLNKILRGLVFWDSFLTFFPHRPSYLLPVKVLSVLESSKHYVSEMVSPIQFCLKV